MYFLNTMKVKVKANSGKSFWDVSNTFMNGTRGSYKGKNQAMPAHLHQSSGSTKYQRHRLRTMDLVYIETKFNEDSTAVPGNQFRQRYPSDAIQIGQPIMGLPCNFYDAAWLQKLSPEQLVVLDVQPRFDINFTVDEQKYVPFTAADPGENEAY